MDIVTLGPPELSEFLPKPLGPGLRFRIVLGKGHQDTDMAHALGLLRPRGKRPCSQGAQRGDELAPPHCLPRSSRQGIVAAQTCILEGAMSALAVFRLITNLNFVGCSQSLSLSSPPANGRAYKRVAPPRMRW